MRTEPSVADTAVEIAHSLARGDEAFAIRLALRLVERYDVSTWEVRDAMVKDEPELTGSAKLDSLLAAVVEYNCAVRHIPAPGWVNQPSRFLEQFWFVADLRGLEAEAFVHSPISFARRGIFIKSGKLEYA